MSVHIFQKNRDWVLQTLSDEVNAARKRFCDAEEYLDLAIGSRRRTARRNSDGEERLRWASRAYMIAARELRTALDLLNRFVLNGIAPDDLKPNATEARRTSFGGRKSA
jgi:hypothetical protein